MQFRHSEDTNDYKQSDLRRLNKINLEIQKSKELAENQNKVLKVQKCSSLIDLELKSKKESQYQSIRAEMEKRKKIKEEKRIKDLNDFKRKKALNLSMRLKRNNTLKNFRNDLARLNKEKANEDNREKKLVNNRGNAAKKIEIKIDDSSHLKYLRVNKKKTVEEHKKMLKTETQKIIKNIVENDIQKKNYEKENQYLKNEIYENKKALYQVKRNIKTAKSQKKYINNKGIKGKNLGIGNTIQIDKESKEKNKLKNSRNTSAKNIMNKTPKSKKNNIKYIENNELLMTTFKRQKDFRDNLFDKPEYKIEKQNNNIMIEKEKEMILNKKINETLEDMCIYGNIMKKEILKEKINNPKKYIEINEALKSEEKDKELFSLGLLSNSLESLGIETVIEKDVNNYEKSKIGDSSTTLQFLSNGFINKKKYKLHFDFGKDRNEQILNDKKAYEKFKENLKLKISRDYNISTDKVIITFLQRGSVEVQVIFQSDEFNDLNTDEFLNKFQNEKNKEFSELKNLKEIHSDVLMGGCKLTKKMLDPRGNRSEGWGVSESRGNMPYDPPLGWIGIGLKVMDSYDDGDNTWIGMSNLEGEWCVAYHGVGRKLSSEKVKDITGKIIKGQKQKFISGGCQVHKDCEDKYNKRKKVGEGVYCTPSIKTAEKYCGISTINGLNYKTVIMVRVKPNAIRCCKKHEYAKDYWVLNGTCDEIRPYRILYKKV